MTRKTGEFDDNNGTENPEIGSTKTIKQLTTKQANFARFGSSSKLLNRVATCIEAQRVSLYECCASKMPLW